MIRGQSTNHGGPTGLRRKRLNTLKGDAAKKFFMLVVLAAKGTTDWFDRQMSRLEICLKNLFVSFSVSAVFSGIFYQADSGFGK